MKQEIAQKIKESKIRNKDTFLSRGFIRIKRRPSIKSRNYPPIPERPLPRPIDLGLSGLFDFERFELIRAARSWVAHKKFDLDTIPCEDCRKIGLDLHGHHPDYRKPDEVIWLCFECHIKEHERIEEIKNDRSRETRFR